MPWLSNLDSNFPLRESVSLAHESIEPAFQNIELVSFLLTSPPMGLCAREVSKPFTLVKKKAANCQLCNALKRLLRSDVDVKTIALPWLPSHSSLPPVRQYDRGGPIHDARLPLRNRSVSRRERKSYHIWLALSHSFPTTNSCSR